MKLGSLCSGYGGLDMAVADVLGPVEVSWFSEIEPRAASVFAHHHPGVPNLGDLTAITDPPPVDIVTGGFPCQPVSSAGKRAGIDDERWLFDDIADLLGRMDPRPRLLVFENVRGLLSANGGDAMGRVVHGLARLGYVGSWRLIRASTVGACHQRARVFIVAHSDGGRLEEQPQLDSEPTQHSADGRSRWAHVDGLVDVAADADGAGAGRNGGPLPRTTAGPRRQGEHVHAAVDAGPTVADATHVGRERCRETWDRWSRSTHDRYGPYAAAVHRWERILGRPAPAPADDQRRLSPLFVEWMMGLPAGHVTDVERSRAHALRILGNGVVPQQAAQALRLLLSSAAPAIPPGGSAV